MTKFIILAILPACLLFFSCNNDDDMSPPIVEEEVVNPKNWNPLSLGSYWVYQKYDAIDGENYETVGKLDTVMLNEAIFMNGNTFRKFDNDLFGIFGGEFQRDSAEYIVTSTGRKIFSVNDSELLITYSDLVFSANDYMKGDTLINFAIGEQTARYSESVYEFDPDFIPEDCGQTSSMYWSKDIGLVRFEYFYSSCHRVRHELVDYHIEPE